MAGIARRSDGQWRARYRDAAGREHALHFDRKVDAQAWVDSATTAVATGIYVDPDGATSTVGELAPVWLTGKINLKPTSRARYADVLRTHVLPPWGNIPLVRVTPSDIQAWLAQLSRSGLSGASVLRHPQVRPCKSLRSTLSSWPFPGSNGL